MYNMSNMSNLGTLYAMKLKSGMLLTLQLCATTAPGPCPGMGLGVKMYNRSNLGTFYARKLKFHMLLRS